MTVTLHFYDYNLGYNRNPPLSVGAAGLKWKRALTAAQDAYK